MVRCGVCGGENPAQMRFCGHCGAALAADVSAPAPALNETLRKLVSDQLATRLASSGGEIGEERRLVTALFADVSGFTALADKLDPEGLVEAINPVLAALTDAAVRYDAYVSKFAGDALLCLFGAPVAHDDDAERALLASLDMLRALDEVTPSLPEHARHLTLHIGVNTGHVVAAMFGNEVRTDYSVLGDAVNTAQRLESQAPSGEIYVGETTWMLTRKRFAFDEIGALSVKGKSEPVRAWRLVGPLEGHTSPAAPFVGRRSEREALAGAVAERRAVGVLGQPGVGKSRLLAEARAGTWLGMRCPSYGAQVAYAPVAEMLRLEAAIPRGESQERARAMLGAMLDRDGATGALPYFAVVAGLPHVEETRDLEPDAFRRRFHDAFSSWLRARGAGALTVEDVHWIDSATLALLRDIAESIPLVLTARPEGEETVRAIDPAATILSLEALPPDEAGALARMLGADDPGIAERAAGNPFFIEELARLGATTSVPPTIEGVLSARIDRLTPAAASLLQVASVIGRRLSSALLADVAGDEALGEPLDALRREGFLEDAGPGTLVFHHALMHDVAYGRLLRKRSRDLHAAVADAVERRWGSGEELAELLAHHRLASGDARRAIDALLQAGERSRRMFANAEAIEHFARAEAAARESGDERLASIVLARADLCELDGRYEEAVERYRETQRLTRMAAAWTGAAAALRKRGRYDDAISVLDEAARDGVDDPAALLHERAWTLLAMGRRDEAIDAAQAGLAHDPEERLAASLRVQRARALTIAHRYDEALRDASAARAAFDRAGDLRGLVTALRVLAGAHRGAGRLDDAATALLEAIALAERTGNVEEQSGCLVNLGLVEVDRGRIDAAIEAQRRAISGFERIGAEPGQAIASANLARMLVEANRLVEAEEWSDYALSLAERLERKPTLADVWRTKSLAALRRGDGAAAREAGRRAAALFTELGMEREAAEAVAKTDGGPA